jgi:hypothetical protein
MKDDVGKNTEVEDFVTMMMKDDVEKKQKLKIL